MSEKQKILICGNVNGRFEVLFSKVDTINKKSGPFDMLLCAGNFFGDLKDVPETYKNGVKKVAVPTYVIGLDEKTQESGQELCPNVTYLGKRGLYVASSGLKIAYIGANEADGESSIQADALTVRNACFKGQPSFRGIDVLISWQWPENVANLDPAKPNIQVKGSKHIAWLAVQVKPRYHVSVSEDTFYERPPYRNDSRGEAGIEIASRFLSLASVGNASRAKWLYALNLTPVDATKLSDLAKRTTDETSSPYPSGYLYSDRPTSPNSQERSKPRQQYFFDVDSEVESKKRRFDRQERSKRQREAVDPDKCWFCLSSPDVSKHLIVSVGSHVYLALAKGGLIEDHLLILPITHHQSLLTLPEETRDEMSFYKKALVSYFANSGRVPVFFERNYKSLHCQLQVVPIDEQLVSNLKEAFRDVADANNLELSFLSPGKELADVAKPTSRYFYAELPNGESLYKEIEIRDRFPLQFGREVLASPKLLNVEERIDWKACQMSQSEEVQLAKRIRQQFSPYDLQ